jgi:protein-L-isoaspartate(D-aspartate) O-methyltransferase
MYEKERGEMVDRLVAFGYIKDERVAEAMRKVPRHLFVPDELEKYAYDDAPLPIGEGQTISAPHMVAMMCEALGLSENHKVLEVGAGSGYHACVVAEIVKRGQIFSIERVEKLADMARKNLAKANCTRIKVIVGDGTEGYPAEAPYDRIFVTAGAPEVPRPLIEQLKEGGRLLIPVGSRFTQDLLQIDKLPGGELKKKSIGGCAFVPLIGKYGW